MPLKSPLRAVLFAAVALFTLALDFATKAWASQLSAPRRAIDGVVRFILAHNTGGAFSVLRDAPARVRVPLFVAITAVALVALVLLYRRAQGTAARVGIALIAGGALGNVLDRARFGYVVDFIDVSALVRGVERHWPTFNVADVAIVAGVALVLLARTTSPRARSSPS